MKKAAIYLWLASFLFLGCNTENRNEAQTTKIITVYAASGSRFVTEIICSQFEKDYNCEVEQNFASSGILARQIVAGADPEIYISANKQWIDYLCEEKILDEKSIHKVAGNSLVIVSKLKNEELSIKYEKDFNINSIVDDKIAIGDPSYVPVGKYAKQVFDTLNWNDKLNEKIVYAKDVTSVLHLVELGEVDWGIVYKTEAKLSNRVNIISEVPDTLHQPINFYIAEIKGSTGTGKELLNKFCDVPGQKVFQDFGFKTKLEENILAEH